MLLFDSLSEKTQRWVREEFIGSSTRLKILAFEEIFKAKRARILLGVIGVISILTAFVLFYVVATTKLNGDQQLFLSSVGVSLVGFGILTWILRSVKYNVNVLLALLVFVVSAILLVIYIDVDSFSGYELLTVCCSLILFPYLLAKRNYRVALACSALFFSGLSFAQNLFHRGMSWSELMITSIPNLVFLAISALMVLSKGALKLYKWLSKYRWMRMLSRRFEQWGLKVLHYLKILLKKLSDIKKFFGSTRVRVLSLILFIFALNMTRKYFPWLDRFLYQETRLNGYLAVSIWSLCLSLILKEATIFSKFFSALGLFEVLMHFTKISVDGVNFSLNQARFELANACVAFMLILVFCSLSLAFTQWKKRTYELFCLGPLGWTVAVALIVIR